MRLQDRMCVLTTMLILLILCFSINISKLKEAATRSCNMLLDHMTAYEFIGVETDCDIPGLFKPHMGCCPHKQCPVNHFPFHLHSGVADVVAAKICFNNTVIMGGIRNNAGQGLNIVFANGQTGEVLRNNYFNMESTDPKKLLAFLKTLKPGNILLVASHMDPTPKLTDEIKDAFTALGSTMVKSLKERDNWLFASTYGETKASRFEKGLLWDLCRHLVDGQRQPSLLCSKTG
ncbi:protein FAM3C-like isoform X2 [Danio aesculapii]|uniref:protein FAM3C-like isoform X2 n=1 Tax=Danio aesculapii TaxID=1142201 RepID=UPI0024BF3B39|nr:protein FAM3C-like isoform X2 [Danio aesculapii]